MSLTRKKPMSRGSKPMSRGAGFQRKGFSSFKPHAAPCSEVDQEQARELRLQERAARAAQMAIANAAAGVRQGVAPVFTDLVVSVEKENHVRHERYRRLGAGFACMHCGLQGRSQFAHGNEGKGISLKTDDRTGFPLCAPDLLDEGCHTKFDQYRLIEGGREAHRELGRKYGAMHRQRIEAAGLWPDDLPKWKK